MEIDELLSDALLDTETPVFEDDFMRVIKVIKEIPTGSKNYVKRLQLVIWKKKNDKVPDFDIRGFSYKENKYNRGMTLNQLEMEELYKALKIYFEDN